MTEEIDILTGDKWTGNLTYLDYQTSKETVIPADVTVKNLIGDDNKFILSMEFPEEPHANYTDTILISLDGKLFAGDKLIEKIIYDSDSIQFKTESYGMDDDEESLFMHTYCISPHIFSIRKDVKYTGDSLFIKRNEFYFIR